VNGLLLEQIENDTLQAMFFYHKALTYNEVQSKAFSKLIDYLQTHSLPDSAIAMADKASEIFPKEIKWKNTKAEILRKNASYERAIQAYQSVFDQDSTQVAALANMADIRIGQKAYSAALQHLKKAILIETKPAKLLYLAGFCNEKLQNYSESQLYYIRAVKAKPDFPQAVEGQERTTRIITRAIGLTY
jgi:tetratricopeptide (TPR) repeat protein